MLFIREKRSFPGASQWAADLPHSICAARLGEPAPAIQPPGSQGKEPGGLGEDKEIHCRFPMKPALMLRSLSSPILSFMPFVSVLPPCHVWDSLRHCLPNRVL